MLIVGLLDNVGEFLLLILEFADLALELSVFQLLRIHLRLVLIGLFLCDSEFVLGRSKRSVFALDFVFKLTDLVGGDLELALEFTHFVLGLNQIFRVQISVRSNVLVQVLLSLKLAFKVDVFLLELANKIFLQLNFLNHLHQVRVCFGRFLAELVSLLLKLSCLCRQRLLHFLVGNRLLAHRRNSVLVRL